MLTLIETNDALSVALSKHQRALLQARKLNSSTPSTNPQVQRPDPAQNSTSAADENTTTQPRAVEPPVVAPAGPPPLLGLPKRAAKPSDNPFDDSHQTSVPAPQPELTLSPNQAAHAASQKDEDDDVESPARARKYRF